MSHHAFYDVIVDIVRLISTDDGRFLMGVLALAFREEQWVDER